MSGHGQDAATDPGSAAGATGETAANAATPLSPIKQALVEIRELRARLAAVEEAAHEPIAVLGMGCRMPGGVHDEESLWRVLAEGVDTIGEIPAERWDVNALHDDDPDRPGTMWTRCGGFLDDVAGFDAAFFGIAPLEAASMDPQQRLMLELAWHALEDAGIAPDTLGGSRTGVFIGVGNGDYGRLLFGEERHIDAHAGSGSSLAVIAGRLSYVLGLQGPALCVDTACSASLVALHLACESLRRGECDLALVGGINLILSPAAHISFTKARMMARDGRCKTFDAAADGYGRGEGAVMLVLQRDSVAARRGARRLARVRGSALNQDGRSSGMTAPNGPAQEAVIRDALAAARLVPADIDYVEAHGTGTSLGDPIELQALAAALGDGHSKAQPLYVGSCKTNFGHLEAAAGLAGVAKTIAALRRRQLPPHLHFRNPNPLLDWAAMPLAVPTRQQPWPERRIDGQIAPARAGVSSFGFSGTNAHVILEEVPAAAETRAAEAPARPWHVLALSARDEPALRTLAAKWEQRLAAPDAAPAVANLCFTALTGRAQLPQRLAVQGGDAAALRAALAAWAQGGTLPGLVAGRAAPQPPKVAFLFSGQGPQHHGMARVLYQQMPAFRDTLDRCAAALEGRLDVPLLDLLFRDPAHAARLDDTAYAQPALFAVQVALAAIWRSFGITPAVVLGHSLGEYAAAHVAGLFPLEDALRVLVKRGRLGHELPGEGAMVSAQASPERLRRMIAALGLPAGSVLEFAAFNGAEQTVLSGDRHAVERLSEKLDAEGVPQRALRISHAFHSSLLEPTLPALAAELQGVRFGTTARCTVVGNLDGQVIEPAAMARPDYWVQQMRQPVQFAKGLATLLAQGVTHVVELSPHPVLLSLAAEEAPDAAVQWLPSMRRDAPEGVDALETLQRLFVDGARIDWAAQDHGQLRTALAAPLMPFNRRRYWIEREPPVADAVTATAAEQGRHVWQRLGAALARQSGLAPIGANVTGYAERWAVLERLTVAHATTVLREAGLFAAAGNSHSAESVRARLGAKDAYRHLLERWLERLAARGDLRREGDTYTCEQPLRDPHLEAVQAQARAALADNSAQLEYMLHCGRLLPAVIRGQESPLETLFPGGSFELAEGIYQRSTPMRYVNALAASAIEALVAARGPRAPVRALEIGAGTGSTTAALVPMLPADRTDYCYTDVTPVFFDLARGKFAHQPFIRFAEFDLERDAAAQGFAPGSFDLVIAANAVHAVRNLRTALASIRSLLAPGGVLLLVESTEHLAWYDMTTGLIEGWQLFADDLRTDNPLLPAPTWLRALRDAGFDEAGAWPPPDNQASQLGQQVIAAWVAGASTGSAHVADPSRATAPAAGAAASAAPASSQAASAGPSLRERLRDASPEEQLELLRDAVRDTVAAVLRLGPDELPARHDRLMDLGMDSLMAVQLRNRFAQMLGLARPLPATLMFDHPTIEVLASYLQPLLRDDGAAGPAIAHGTEGKPKAPSPSPDAQPATQAAATPAPAALGAERVARMSDEEIELLLLERLEAKQR